MTAEGITVDETNQAPITGWGTFEAPELGTLWLVWTDVGFPEPPRPTERRKTPISQELDEALNRLEKLVTTTRRGS